MPRICFLYNKDVFLRDLARQYAESKLTTDEYLDILEDLISDLDRKDRTQVEG